MSAGTTAKNLLFIFSDQHAPRVTGCYGDPHVQTPALDALAARGVRLTNAYCASPICVPSRMSMLTARYPSSQQCWTNDDHLATDIPTWLHALGAAGHQPELIGRMHSMGPDQMHGYVRREVGDHSPNWAGIPRHDMGPLDGTNEPQPESLVACGAGQSAYEVKDRDVTEAALAALDRIAGEDRPFCLTVGLMLPHAPYVTAEKWIDHYMNVLPPPPIPPAPEGQEHPWIAWWRHNRDITDVPDAKSRLARAAYWGLVSAMDEMIGRILDRLKALGLEQETLVIYASDHGDHVGDRGLWWKHTLFDDSAKVPVIAALPGVLPAGQTSERVCSLIDIAQTMVEALGGTPLPHADGRSLWPVLTGASDEWDDIAFSEYCTDAVPHWTGGRAVRQRMLRDGRWKLHYYWQEPPLLFNLETDPLEQHNLADDPAHKGRLQAMLARLLDGWDPAEIDRIMKQRRARKDVLAGWAAQTKPPSTQVWPMPQGVNQLYEGKN